MDANVDRIPIQLSRDCVVASLQIDLSEAVLNQFRDDLLQLLHASGARGVILDVAGIDVLDVEDFEALKRAMAMAALMGARTVFSGFRPGVVASLIELDADVAGIIAALNLDEAFRILEEDSHGTERAADDEHEETGDDGASTATVDTTSDPV